MITTLDSRIVKDPNIVGGKPRIAGHRINSYAGKMNKYRNLQNSRISKSEVILKIYNS